LDLDASEKTLTPTGNRSTFPRP